MGEGNILAVRLTSDKEGVVRQNPNKTKFKADNLIIRVKNFVQPLLLQDGQGSVPPYMSLLICLSSLQVGHTFFSSNTFPTPPHLGQLYGSPPRMGLFTLPMPLQLEHCIFYSFREKP